jgi:hypothetical protein
MSSWGKNDNSANAPYWAVNSTITKAAPSEIHAAPTAANVAYLYGNTAPSAYITNETVGLFLVDATEEHAGSDNITDVSIITGGARYVEAPGVTFSGGGGASAAATATISGGVVTKIVVTNTGSSYETVPTVTVQVPVLTVGASSVNLTFDTINYASHGQANSAALVYNNGGGTSIVGLTSGNTYYVTNSVINSFKLATTAANAANNVTIDLTGQGNNNQYFTIVGGTRATALAIKGLGQDGGSDSGFTKASHVGWNLKRVGTGGRAGRVQYETLVALANPIGDGSDDIALPDA